MQKMEADKMNKAIRIVIICILGLLLITIFVLIYVIHTWKTGLGALESTSRMAFCLRLIKIEILALIISLLIMGRLKLKEK